MKPISVLQTLFATVLVIYTVTAEEQEINTCKYVKISEALGTEKFLLYGLTSECRIFFATNIDAFDFKMPDGHLEQQKVYDCSDTILEPIRDRNGKLRLLVVFKQSNTVYERVVDFPTFADNEWFKLSEERIMECIDIHGDCKVQGQFLRNLKNSPQLLGFVDETRTEFYLLAPDYYFADGYNQYPIKIHGFSMAQDGKLDFVKVNLRGNPWKMSYVAKEPMDNQVIIKKIMTDHYAGFLYFTTLTKFYRTPLSTVKDINILEQTLGKEPDWAMDIDGNDDFKDSSFSIVNNKKIILKFSNPSKTMVNISKTMVNIKGRGFDSLSSLPHFSLLCSSNSKLPVCTESTPRLPRVARSSVSCRHI